MRASQAGEMNVIPLLFGASGGAELEFEFPQRILVSSRANTKSSCQVVRADTATLQSVDYNAAHLATSKTT